MMRNIYLRLLFSIVLITVCVMTAQTLILFASVLSLQKSWKQEVFEAYVGSLEENIASKEGDISLADLMSYLISSAPDRVSGLLIRDDVGDVSISIGSSSRGEYIPQLQDSGSLDNDSFGGRIVLPKTFSISVNTTREYHVEDVRRAAYTIDLSSHVEGREIVIDGFSISPSGETGYVDVKLPSVISAGDIAGTIRFLNNGNVYGYVDILVYDLDVYGPTYMIIHNTTRVFFYFLPIAILIALVAGYFISKRNARHIRNIQYALSGLANGEYDIHVDKDEFKINELRGISDSIMQLGRDLERHQQSRREWFKNISHDLNTPVTSMNILLSGADDGLFNIDKDLIKALKKENDTLMERIASVSYYSNLVGDKPDIQMRSIDVYDLADAVLQGKTNCSFECSAALSLYADFNLAKRALTEIVNNAEEYSPAGSRIIWKVMDGGGSVVMRISNRGSLPSPRPQFFEPWARGDSSRHQGGSGLGLPIVYQIMEIHDGSVQIDEEDGFVSVTLTFPKEASR